MGGALIETEARTILRQGIKQGFSQGIQQGKTQGISEANRKTALRMLQAGKLTVDEIAEYIELDVAEVKQLAENQATRQ